MGENPSYENLKTRVLELEREVGRLRKINAAHGQNDAAGSSAPGGNGDGQNGCIGTEDSLEERLDRYLGQGEKMEAIGTLAGGIAHDFNNILFPIVGYTEMTLAELPEGCELHQNLREVLKGADRAGELVRKILRFSGREGRNLKPVRVQQVLADSLAKIARSTPDNIVVKSDIDPDCGTVRADPVMIHRMITNLCSNAGRAMAKEGGTIEVGLSRVRSEPGKPVLSSMGNDASLLLTVGDSGEGMDFLQKEKIFEPYFTTREKGRGTGLGLSVVYGIVKRLGGEIRVESAPAKGTRFSIFLPVNDERSTFPGQVSGAGTGGRCDSTPINTDLFETASR